MRVAILTRDYPPAIGGVATHVEGLVNALRRRGIEADVFVGSNDVKTLLLPFDIPLKKYDVVHVQSSPYGAFVVGVPLVVTVHSPVLEEMPHYKRSLQLISLPAIPLERISLSRAAAVLAVSDESRSELLREYGLDSSKVEVIGNGVEYERFSASRSGRARLKPPRILVVSRLEPRKNVAEAIEAFAELPKGSCQLDIAGDGSERHALVELAKKLGVEDRVHFLGRVSSDALPEIYGDASIFLTTSSSEGFGLSLLEAMSSSCACIASNLPTHRALIERGVTGMIYSSRAALVSMMRELCESPDKAERLGAAAREAAKRHSWDNVAQIVIEAYEKVTSGSKVRPS